MLRDIYHKLLSAFVVLALMLPAMTSPASAGTANLLCSQNAQMSPEAAKALAEISELLGLGNHQDAPNDNHDCSHCVLIAVQTFRTVFKGPDFEIGSISYLSNTALGFSYGAQGPPLGSRAPPISA